VSLPPGAGKFTVTLVHAAVLSLLYFIIAKYVLKVNLTTADLIVPAVLFVLLVSTVLAHSATLAPTGWAGSRWFYLALLFPVAAQFLYRGGELNETATRRPEQFGMPDVKAWIAYGASPRASLGIIAAARALALVRGRDYVVPQDVIEVIPDVLRHRLVLTYDALADDVKAETVIGRILQTVGMPQVNAVPQQGYSAPPAGSAVSPAAGANGR
jgi:hypothetical protein